MNFRLYVRQNKRAIRSNRQILVYKIRKYVNYMIPLFALSLRRSEEFTNALVARGYAFTGEASRIKRADYVLTHYSFKYYDAIFTAIISISFIALLIMRFRYNYFAVDQSALLNWLQNILL